MHYRLTDTDRSAPTRLGQSSWLRSQLPEALGTCFTDQWVLDEGLALIYADFSPRYDLLETSTQERERSLTLTVALEGRSSSTGTNGQRFDFVSGHSTVAAYGSMRGERRFPANQSIRQLRLVVKISSLAKYGLEGLLDGVSGERSAHPLFRGKHGAVVQRLADSLVHLHDRNGSLLDTHIAALSLLAEQTRQFVPRDTPVGKMRSDDQDRLLRARELLMSQYDRALSVPYLCAAVGTNEFKLKQGFREMFGTSPHRMLTDIRMAKAWELLESGVRVSTVAFRVGYQHLSSFSAAFERYYGKTPKSVSGGKSLK